MGELKPLLAHRFYTDFKDGYFVGRCEEWPRLRTKRLRSKLDALDAITAAVADQLREIHGEMPIKRAGGQR